MFSNSTSMFAVGVRVNPFTAVFPYDAQPTMSEAIKAHSMAVERLRSANRDVKSAGVYHLKAYALEDFLSNWRKYMAENCLLAVIAIKDGKTIVIPNALAGEVFTAGGDEGSAQLRRVLTEISDNVTKSSWQIAVATPADSMAKGNSPIHKIVEEARKAKPGGEGMAEQFQKLADDFSDKGMSDSELARELEKHMPPGARVAVVDDPDDLREFLEKQIAEMTGLSGSELKAAVDDAVTAIESRKPGDSGALSIKIPVNRKAVQAPRSTRRMDDIEEELKPPHEYTLAEISRMPSRGVKRLFSTTETPLLINYKEASELQQQVSDAGRNELRYLVTSEFPCGCEVVHSMTAYFSTTLTEEFATKLFEFCEAHYPHLQHRIYVLADREYYERLDKYRALPTRQYFPIEADGYNVAVNGEHRGAAASFPHTILEHETQVPEDEKKMYKLFAVYKTGKAPSRS